jgi:hypothetical protein
MALMLGKLYDALLAGGVDEPRARAAAEGVAQHISYGRVAKIRTDLTILKGMVGANLVDCL